ncbi:hypothetical protein CYLTODRAFT_446799 [Cylindrobasidium torrendii FP15055 ss-10]|uniref:F-box domain-containing protein n=1 Tax=Cylindrobasidium torrendii FP15055 ss-10 TaxID=1314674 RepID=A0A0D7AXM2_9AGAR|nr:hypothetical protein CYLTODRAFT_446799 [Cylindrobasidium torrendii FP15055 ss-10]
MSSKNTYTPPSTDWQSFVQDPRLHQLIDPPSDFDFQTINTQTKDTIRTYTSDFDAQVASLEQSIAQLTIQRDLLASLSHRLKSFVPLVNAIPDGVLLDIFQLCLDAGPLHRHDTLFRLTQVCRHWRKLVIASPLLWSHIDVDWVGFHRDGEPYSLAASAFQRAHHVPLHVTIDVTEIDSILHTGYRLGVQDVLNESLNRCRRLDITHRTVCARKDIELLGLDRWELPMLEELRLKFCSLILFEPEELGFVSEFPKLTILHVEGGHRLENVGDSFDNLWRLKKDSPHFPWHQLTTLSWTVFATTGDFLKILAVTTKLEILEIGDMLRADPLDQSTLRVTLMHLKTLRIEWAPAGILQRICCPGLEHLIYSRIKQDFLVAFLLASKPPLKTMGTSYLKCWQDFASDAVMCSIPILEEFVVTEPLENLSYMVPAASSVGGHFPLTKTLTLHVSDPFDEVLSDKYGIILFVRLYWPHRGLQKLKLHAHVHRWKGAYRDSSQDFSRERIRTSPLLQGLEEMRSEGLEVTVTYSPSTDPDDEASREYY